MPKSRFTPTQPKTAAAAPAPLVENKVNESHLKAPAVPAPPALKRNFSSANHGILGDRNGGGRDQGSGAGTGGKRSKRFKNGRGRKKQEAVAPGE